MILKRGFINIRGRKKSVAVRDGAEKRLAAFNFTGTNVVGEKW